MQGRIFRWKTAAEQFAYYDSGKYSAPYMSNLSGTSYYNRFILATEETNLPLMTKGRAKGWIKGDPYTFYRDEAQRVTSFANGEFMNNTSLTSFIEFEHFGIKVLPQRAFELCTNLVDIIYPATLTAITGSRHFYDCGKITALPNMTNLNVANYGIQDSGDWGGFATRCKAVKNDALMLANSAKIYYRLAFYGMNNITEITIPSGATEIHYVALGPNLKKLTLLDGGKLTLQSQSVFFNASIPHIIISERTICPTLYPGGSGGVADVFKNAQNTTIYYPAGSDYSHWQTYQYSGLKTNCRFIPCQRGEDGHLVIPEEN